MKLKSISLKGYRGIPNIPKDPGLEIKDFGHRNIFIGPNNSGKSTIFRFLHYLKSSVEAFESDLHTIQKDIDQSWWWRHEASVAVSASIAFAIDSTTPEIASPLLDNFIVDNEWQLEVLLKAYGDDGCILMAAPRVYLEGQWYPIVKQNDDGTDKPIHLNNAGEYISSSGRDSCPYHEPALKLVKAWASSVRFFDPVRAVDRGPGSREMDDGAGLLADLFRRQLDPRQTARHNTFVKALVNQINKLLDPGGIGGFEGCELKGSETEPQMYLSQKGLDGPPIALDSMGTGIAELVILISSLVEDTEQPMQYFIEEPEIHLHPGLLRRLMNSLSDFPDVQFFISSHSNVVLDALESNDRVFHFYQRSDGACVAAPCQGIVAQHRLLDSLGVCGSTLLQTNCVIWVEGPSDRLYIRHWLQQTDPGLQEGSDYAFVFYGGKILSHFSFESSDADTEDLLSMIRVSRYSAVVMDRDLAPSEPEETLREAKRKILEEAKSDPGHRLGLITEGREIENDLPIEVLRRAFSQILGTDEYDFQELALSGEQRYPDEVVTHLGINGDDAKTVKSKVSNKMALARTVLDIFEEGKLELQPPVYVEALKEFIIKSRTLESGNE
jgi:hypothetical protein